MKVTLPERHIEFKFKHPEKWKEIEDFLIRSDFSKKCHAGDEDYGQIVGFRMFGFDGQTMDVLKYHAVELARLSIEKFESDLREIASRPYGKNREVLQYVYDYLKKHGDWPKSRELLTGDFYDRYGDIYQVAESIGPPWIQATMGNNDPEERTTIGIRSVSLCKDSQEDLAAFLRAVQYLVKVFRENKGAPQEIPFDEIKEAVQISEEQSQRIQVLLCREGHGYLIPLLVISEDSGGRPVLHLPGEKGYRSSYHLDTKIMQYAPAKTMKDYLKLSPSKLPITPISQYELRSWRHVAQNQAILE